jgi:hypothetical protein
LFVNKYILVHDVKRKGYWLIFKKTISWVEEPVYDFNWPTISEEEFKERFPKHYKNYCHHRFIIGV